MAKHEAYLWLWITGCSGNFYFSIQTDFLSAHQIHILQKNQFAATRTSCFYCVCSQILFLLCVLVFIVVVFMTAIFLLRQKRQGRYVVSHPGLPKTNGLLWKLMAKHEAYLWLWITGCSSNFYFSIQTDFLSAHQIHILQKNQFAATRTSCFYCVCSQILFLLCVLVFIVVVPC